MFGKKNLEFQEGIMKSLLGLVGDQIFHKLFCEAVQWFPAQNISTLR